MAGMRAVRAMHATCVTTSSRTCIVSDMHAHLLLQLLPCFVQGGVRPVAVFEEGAGGDSDDDVEVVHSAAPVAVGPRAADGEQVRG